MNIENNIREEEIKSILLGRTKEVEVDGISQTDLKLILPSREKTEETLGAKKTLPSSNKKI
jgi:hypothetical protein